jgi:hypothetical protein
MTKKIKGKKTNPHDKNVKLIRKLIKKKKSDKQFATYDNDNAVDSGE